MESISPTKYITFSSNSKAETVINESDIDDVFESTILLLYQTDKIILENVRVGLFTQKYIILFTFQS